MGVAVGDPPLWSVDERLFDERLFDERLFDERLFDERLFDPLSSSTLGGGKPLGPPPPCSGIELRGAEMAVVRPK